MNNKKKIIFLILILIIILFTGYLLVKNTGYLFNNSINNETISNHISKNISSNIDNISTNDNSTNIKNVLSDKYSDYENKYNHQHIKKSKYKSSEITADDILKIVKRGVVWEDSNGESTHDVRLSKPYKDKDGFWLVGAFDKKTGKFLGAIWVFPEGGGFTNGPDSYSEYKNIISGKSVHESDSNRYDVGNNSNHVVEEIPDSSDFYVLAKVNPNISLNSVDKSVDINGEGDVLLDMSQQFSIKDSSIGMNYAV